LSFRPSRLRTPGGLRKSECADVRRAASAFDNSICKHRICLLQKAASPSFNSATARDECAKSSARPSNFISLKFGYTLRGFGALLFRFEQIVSEKENLC
jgi:hypothetical protein